MSSEYTTLHIKTTNHTATLCLNRPQVHNAFDEIMIAELTQAIEYFNQDDNTQVIILKGEGKHFCAGADLNWMRRMADFSWDDNHKDALQLAHLMQTLYQSPKITVAFIQGAVYGGAVGLVACCDMAFAQENARFCLSETKIGLIPAVISPYVVKAMGYRQASRYFVTAEVIDANTAKNIHLVHDIFATEDFDSKTQNILNTLLDNAPNAIQASKQLVRRADELELGDVLIQETAKKIADVRASDEGKEGLSAFLEKRSPSWRTTQDS